MLLCENKFYQQLHIKIKHGPKKIGREDEKRCQGNSQGGIEAVEETKDHTARQYAATHSDVTGLKR